MRKGGVAKIVKNEIVSSSVVLVAVTVWAGLVVPTTTLPKSSCSGFTSSSSSFSPHAYAIPGRARMSAKRRAKLRTENAKMDNFGRDMANPPKSSAVTNGFQSVPHPLSPADKLADSVPNVELSYSAEAPVDSGSP